ncbi:SymE family type I addiction module toxin [Clostridium formicaceticum]|uniref:Toxin SymE-like domain-containing protein n=1 Tax=Clostridium formicaceticum TaxID=1497 RepID=A0AAC9WHT9_9CLOT|nr:SymE family type I addiction module toxin [Clostridium formicaceticum]AOY74728.1 hypothetical protein BJL90_01420 [Clostridium formicaceticum]ARE89114.1 hypothetical protein CLFO_35200 [Clostridium formicaceticum]
MKTRTLKVYEGTGVNNRVPRVNLQGKWLQNYGFEIGAYIEVKCNKNMLVITIKETIVKK